MPATTIAPAGAPAPAVRGALPRRRARLRALVRTVHLVLGLASGLVVFGVALSGAIYVFEEEIRALYQTSYTRVRPRDPATRLAASELQVRGETALAAALGRLDVVENTGLGLSRDPSHAATYWGYREKPSVYYQVYLDPYTGDVLRVHNINRDPLYLVRAFHQSLLLPYEVGHQIVGWSVVVFLVMLVTGLILWWPRRSSRGRAGWLRAKLTVRWSARWKRVNYDLHSVFGLYVLLLALVVAVTGLVWSFPWVDKAIYWAATGGGQKHTPDPPKSRLPQAGTAAGGGMAAIDLAYAESVRRVPEADRFSFEMPKEATSPLSVWAVVVGNGSESSSYRWSGLYFDQYTAALLGTELYADLDRGKKLSLMNYSIHVGKILGLPGQLLALAVCLVVAGLPVTGFLLWWNRGRRAPGISASARSSQGAPPSGGCAGASR